MRLRHLQPVVATMIGLAIQAPILWDKNFSSIMMVELLMKPLVVVTFIGLAVLLIFEKREMRRSTLLAMACLPVAAATSYAAFGLSAGDRVRWLVERSAHIREIDTSAVAPGDLKHMQWHEDGWGGLNSFEYAIYDPTDRLSEALSQSKDGRVPGIPCPADYNFRFERGYYLVTFPLPWGYCGPQ